MTQVSLNPVPRGRDVVLEQIRIVGLKLRPAALVLAIILGVITLLVARDIVSGTAETWFDADDWTPFSFAAFLLPFAVWRRERRFGPAFLWTLPVDRRRLALAKVFAGWVWGMGALAALASWQFALSLLAGVAGAQIVPLVAFAGTSAMYVLASALVLGLRHPLRWLSGIAGFLFVLRTVDETVLRRGPYGIDALLGTRPVMSAIADVETVWPFLLLGAGLVALWVAVSRHRENR